MRCRCEKIRCHFCSSSFSTTNQPYNPQSSNFKMAFRSTISTLAPRVLRASSSSSARMAAVSPIRQSTFNLTKTAIVQQRSFASGGGLSHDQIQERITDVLKSFEKVNPAKVSMHWSRTSNDEIGQREKE